MPELVYQSATVSAFTPNHMRMPGHHSDRLPHCDAGIVGHTTGHDSFGPLDDALVLWRLGDACASCREHSGPFIQRSKLNFVAFLLKLCKVIKDD